MRMLGGGAEIDSGPKRRERAAVAIPDALFEDGEAPSSSVAEPTRGEEGSDAEIEVPLARPQEENEWFADFGAELDDLHGFPQDVVDDLGFRMGGYRP